MDFFRKLKDHIIPSERNVYRPHMLRRPWLIFFVVVALTTESVFVFDLVARQSAFTFLSAVLPGEVIALTNTERAQNNAGALAENPLLTQAAQAKAEDMAAKGYFAHVGPDGTEPWVWIRSAGYTYQYAGENLAVKFTDSREVVSAWMASPTHRANIVKPQYTEIGIGIAEGSFRGEPATFIVQYFGTPRGVAAAPSQQLASVASATVQAQEQVAGAEVVAESAVPQPAHEESPWSSFLRGMLDTQTNSDMAVLWVLAGVASLLIVGLAFTFFVHIQIQPTDMLVSAAVVVVVTLAFIALNTQVVPITLTQTNDQTAAVFGAVPTMGGFVDANAAFASQ
jgi:hypothetical protein